MNRQIGPLIEEIIVSDPFGGWSRHATAWTRRPGPTVVVRYTELVQHPAATMANALGALDVDLCLRGGELPSFAELHDKWPSFFRRGQTGAWRDEMPPELHALFWSKHGDVMRRLGYIDT